MAKEKLSYQSFSVLEDLGIELIEAILREFGLIIYLHYILNLLGM